MVLNKITQDRKVVEWEHLLANPDPTQHLLPQEEEIKDRISVRIQKMTIYRFDSIPLKLIFRGIV